MGKITMKHYKLWPTHFLEEINPNHKKLSKSLIRYIYSFDKGTRQSEVGRTLKRNISEPPFDFLRAALHESDAFVQLLGWINMRMRKFVRSMNKDYLRSGLKWHIHHHETWYHITRNGGFHGPHMHSNTSWGWIYYFNNLDVKKVGGSNKFYNPCSQHVTYTDTGIVFMEAIEWSWFEVIPKAGKLIVYPGWLLHDAQPYFGKNDRIILSGNTQIWPKK
jgi:uncharacterized protein (TIGR02466 family)